MPAEAGNDGVHDRSRQPAGVITPDQIEQHLGRNGSTATLQEHHEDISHPLPARRHVVIIESNSQRAENRYLHSDMQPHGATPALVT